MLLLTLLKNLSTLYTDKCKTQILLFSITFSHVYVFELLRYFLLPFILNTFLLVLRNLILVIMFLFVG